MGNGLATRKAWRFAAIALGDIEQATGAFVKCEEPAVRGGLFKFSGMMYLPAYALTRDARNVGAHDAEIGKFAVAEQVELALGAIVTVPALETIGEQVEHCLSPMD